MKKTLLILVMCLALCAPCLAEKSSADEFMDNLSKTWDSFLNMASDAMEHVSAWADEFDLSDWAEGALNDVTAWYEQSGIAEWTESAVKEIRAFAEENGPAVKAWLENAGEEVSEAWDVLMNAAEHTREELQDAYKTVTDSLAAAGEAAQP